MTKEEAINYLQQLYPNGGHCWLDEQRIDAISMAIDALKEPKKKCMFASDNFNDEDRKVTCDGCEEKCKYAQKEEPVSETNKVIQKRRCLEEIASTINPFIDEVIEQFDLKNKSITAKEIQYRGVGLKGDFGENICRSDDEIIYILKEDKTVGLIVIRRTEFNNAEITMVKTEERF